MKLQLMGDKLLIERDPIITKTSSGLLIPESSWKPRFTGTVTEVGTSVLLIKKGDRVRFSDHGLKALEIDGEEFQMCSEFEIVAKIL